MPLKPIKGSNPFCLRQLENCIRCPCKNNYKLNKSWWGPSAYNIQEGLKQTMRRSFGRPQQGERWRKSISTPFLQTSEMVSRRLLKSSINNLPTGWLGSNNKNQDIVGKLHVHQGFCDLWGGHKHISYHISKRDTLLWPGHTENIGYRWGTILLKVHFKALPIYNSNPLYSWKKNIIFSHYTTYNPYNISIKTFNFTDSSGTWHRHQLRLYRSLSSFRRSSCSGSSLGGV